MSRPRAGYLLATLSLTLIATGCSMTALPTYDVARDEARASLQDIVDRLPTTAEVSDESVDTPYPCDEGFIYTGHWTVRLPADFDVAGFLSSLPESIGDGYEVDDSLVPSDDAVAVRDGNRHGILIDITDVSTAEASTLDLLTMSRCAQPPES